MLLDDIVKILNDHELLVIRRKKGRGRPIVCLEDKNGDRYYLNRVRRGVIWQWELGKHWKNFNRFNENKND